MVPRSCSLLGEGSVPAQGAQEVEKSPSHPKFLPKAVEGGFLPSLLALSLFCSWRSQLSELSPAPFIPRESVSETFSRAPESVCSLACICVMYFVVVQLCPTLCDPVWDFLGGGLPFLSPDHSTNKEAEANRVK